MHIQSPEKKSHYATDPRLGMLLITHETLRDRELISALFSHVTILETEPHESGRGMRFVLQCELFDELKNGEELPEYRIEMAPPGKPFDNPEHEQRKQVGQAPGFRFVAIRKIIVRAPLATAQHNAMTVH